MRAPPAPYGSGRFSVGSLPLESRSPVGTASSTATLLRVEPSPSPVRGGGFAAPLSPTASSPSTAVRAFYPGLRPARPASASASRPTQNLVSTRLTQTGFEAAELDMRAQRLLRRPNPGYLRPKSAPRRSREVEQRELQRFLSDPESSVLSRASPSGRRAPELSVGASPQAAPRPATTPSRGGSSPWWARLSEPRKSVHQSRHLGSSSLVWDMLEQERRRTRQQAGADSPV
mmetsp:Transcript_28309/g.92415  ORF Transcript_28309/g.92415 Transcript_28309/m.92415 type:complete len:231 (-) Transcript_28309:108-800(-)